MTKAATVRRNNLKNLDRPASLDAAVDRLLSILDEDTLIEVAAREHDQLNDLHFGLGLAIRNAWVWPHNPELCAREGIPVHPDDCSAVIIKALWERLRADGW